MLNTLKIKLSGLVKMMSVFALVSCSTSVKSRDEVASNSVEVNRKIASLDNNGEVHDDGFDPNLETYFGGSPATEAKANADVAEVIRSFIDAQKKIREEMARSSAAQSAAAERVFKDLPKPDYATRDVHRKTNGCFKARLDIASNLKESLNAQLTDYHLAESSINTLPLIQDSSELGVFAPGRSYDAVVRFSNGHPGNRPDKLPDARGLAVKILKPGTLSADSIADESSTHLNEATQLDILSINFPTFFMNDPIKYAAFNKTALDSSKDFKNKWTAKAEEFESLFVSGHLTAVERRLALWVNGSVIYSPLYQEYFSMVPSRLGSEGVTRAVKYSWKPVACPGLEPSAFEAEKKVQWANWTTDHTYALPPRTPAVVKKGKFADDYLRQHLSERIAKDDFCFDLFFQLYRDGVSTSIEDSTDLWARTEAEKSSWINEVVPSKFIWATAAEFNTESRDAYLERFKQKKIAPAIFAGKLRIKKIAKSAPVENNKTCEDLSFNPWNGDIHHHKPLGIVSRMKRKVYNASRRERHQLNGIDDRSIERQ